MTEPTIKPPILPAGIEAALTEAEEATRALNLATERLKVNFQPAHRALN